MKLPLSWLNEYVAIDDIEPKKLADTLLNIGFEVEEIIYMGEGITNVVSGKILDIKKHIDADKLQVCMVDVSKEITTIVTGAHNIAVGDIVPIALDGAVLPGGKKINSAPLRGVMSYGMMCSGAELGVDNSVIEGAEADGILILPKDIALGVDIKDILRLNDYVFDVSVTANRPDCQSVYGMAREIGAVLGRKVKQLLLKYKSADADFAPKVEVTNFALCSRYTAQVIDNVVVERSPDWMRDRLRMVGIRPINNLVDITNYVLIEVGQPLHAFDTRFVDELGIVVRQANDGEEIVALDGVKYELKQNMLLICDKNKPLAIAGVMGGEKSGICSDTTTVLLEAARFSKGCIRATSRMLGLRSDSSARYEKGVDWQSVDTGRERALALISQLKAGRVTSSVVMAQENVPQEKIIVTSAQEISALLGINIKNQVITKILKALEFGVELKDDKLRVTVPLFREDVDNFTDIAEEIIRFYGYDNIESTFLKSAAATRGGISERQNNINIIKSKMCGVGAYEVTTYSFLNRKIYDKLNLAQDSVLRNGIAILNPLSEEYAVMRTQLAGNMLSVVNLNLTRKNKNFRLFEIGRTYIAKQLPLVELPQESETLCVAFVGEGEDFYSLKSCVMSVIPSFMGVTLSPNSVATYLHPGMSADIMYNEQKIGAFGKAHPQVLKNFGIAEDVYIAEINLETIINSAMTKISFKPLPKFPGVARDLAVTVDEKFTVGEMIDTIKSSSDLCESVELFDVYKGEQIEKGQMSVAFSIKLQSQDKTLADSEIQQAMDGILSRLQNAYNAKIRN